MKLMKMRENDRKRDGKVRAGDFFVDPDWPMNTVLIVHVRPVAFVHMGVVRIASVFFRRSMEDLSDWSGFELLGSSSA